MSRDIPAQKFESLDNVSGSPEYVCADHFKLRGDFQVVREHTD